MISILLPCYMSDDVLLNVFSRIQSQVPLEIVYYDNGGNDQYKALLTHRDGKCGISSHSCYKWIGDGQNIGLNAALNECAKIAKYDLFYLAHSDMLPLPGWDWPLINEARRNVSDKFLFCSRSIEPSQGHTPFHIIKDYGREPCDFQHEALEKDFAAHKDHGIVTGYRMPMFCHRKLWEKMDGVDPNYFSYATDDDLFMTAYHVGVRKFWMINQSLVYHMQGKSNQQQTVDKDSRKPYDYFNDKWKKLGYDTDQPIDNLMQSLIPWNIKLR